MFKSNIVLLAGMLILLLGCQNRNANTFEQEGKVDSGTYLPKPAWVKMESGTQEEVAPIEMSLTDDPLISLFREMKTDTLDCTAVPFWKVVKLGESYIPKLLDGLTDTSMTPIYDGCKGGKLQVGELCYYALDLIAEFPAFLVTGIQFDIGEEINGWDCWNFFTDYLFTDQGKADFQEKAKDFYLKNKEKYAFKRNENHAFQDCFRKFGIKGKLVLP